MTLKKNVASQKWRVYAFDSTDGSPVTGDAANITGKIALDWAAAVGITDTNPTETEDGSYVFDLTQGETNADNLDIYPESSTADVLVVGSPASQSTVPQYFSELGIASDGDLTKVNTLDGHTAQTADVAGVPTTAEFEARTISATAAAALEDQYDTTGLSGDTYPATQAQLGAISNVGAAVNTPAESYVLTTGTQLAGTYSSTAALDGTEHQHEDTVGALEFYYQFDIGGNGVPTSVTVTGRLNGGNDDLDGVYAYNWSGTSWDRVGDFDGQNGSTNGVHNFDLYTSHVGTGANLGLVRIQFYAASGLTSADIYIDQIFTSYAVVAQSVGYAEGAIWVDSAGTAGSEPYVNGVADKPCPWANALVLNSVLGLNRFHIANDNTVTLSAACDDKTLFGDHWYLALGGQSVNDSLFQGAHVTGIGSSVDHANFDHCQIGAGTFPPSIYHDCGIGLDAGQFTAASAGQYVFHHCYSMVPGSGSPAFVFTGNGASSGINNRGWHGGATYTLDSDCVLSHEVSGGGGTTITTGGADVEVRGICRELTLVCSAAETVQFVGICGDIGISGTTTAAINLYGVGDGVTDTSSAATVTNKLVSLDNVNTEADTALSDYDAPTKTELDSAFTEIKGATWAGTDTLEGIYNGLGGSAPTVEQVRAEMDSNSTQLAAIVADTNELQTDWANGGRLDLLVDAILTDTGELQADITNGGRVDLLIDGIKAVTDALTVAAATKLALSSGTMVVGTVEAGTLSTTQMTTDLSEATTGHYNDRLIIWLTGDLANQVSEVTLYTAAAGLIDHPATTEAPSAGDTFLLL